MFCMAFSKYMHSVFFFVLYGIYSELRLKNRKAIDENIHFSSQEKCLWWSYKLHGKCFRICAKSFGIAAYLKSTNFT